MSVPNQKIVQIAPRTKRDKEHLFAMMNIKAMQQAMLDLNGAWLKMWLYLNKNQDNYRMELSRQACLEWGIKKDSYYNGLRELEERGYLRPSRPGSNIYYFYESAASENQTSGKMDFYISQNSKPFSAQPKNISGFPTEMAEKPYRNNTYNTKIKQDRTPQENPYDDWDYWEAEERAEEEAARKKRAAFRELGF